MPDPAESDSTAVDRPPRPQWLLLGLLALAAVLKAVWAFNSIGSYDAAMFFNFARDLETRTIAQLYRAQIDFNHTPLTATLISGLYGMANGEYRLFSGAFRLLSILADLSVAIGLLVLQPQVRLPRWAVAAFILSPVGIVLAGFHGNVDPILTAVLFFAVVAAWRERPLTCGALLALAANFKIVPLLLVPAFLGWWWVRGRRPTGLFLAALAAGLTAGFGPLLLTHPALLLRNVFGYGGFWGSWGIPYLLSLTGAKELQVVAFTNLPVAEVRIMLALKVLTIAGVCWIAWRRRFVTGSELMATVAASLAVIYVLAPGGAAQYMAWFGPFLLLAARRWWVVCTLAATLFQYAFYSASAHGPFPWFVVFPRTGEEALWIPWTIVPWLAFLALLMQKFPEWIVRVPKSSEMSVDGRK